MIQENVEYNDFRNMNQLLEGSLGKDIMNKYLVNRDLDVFHNISRLISYLHTDFYHTMEDYTLVLSGGHNTLVSDLLFIDLKLIPDSKSLTLISSLLENTSHKLIEISSTSTDSFYGSMNDGMKAIVDSLNELSQEEDAMSDFRNLINEESNGVGSSLGNMKLTLIKKFLVPVLQDLDYLKDSYYGLPVLINKEIV